MLIKLNIIQEDIDKAVEYFRNNPRFPDVCANCVIAQAFKRHGHKLVHIGVTYGSYFDENIQTRKLIYDIPEKITNISVYKSQEIKPQEIELDIL